MAALFDFEYYVTNLDWNDGTPIQYTSQPKIFDRSFNFTHNYALPGFYSIKGLIYKKTLKTLNIYPPATDQVKEYYDEFQTTPSDEADEYVKLGLTEPLSFIQSRDTKDTFINEKLNPNIDLNLGWSGDIYKITRIFRSATSIAIHNSEDDRNGSFSIEVPRHDADNRTKSSGIAFNLGMKFDLSVYNFFNFSMDLWLPAFQRKNPDGTNMSPQPIAYFIYVRAYRLRPDIVEDEISTQPLDYSDFEQQLRVVRGTDSWQKFEDTFFIPFPVHHVQLFVTQADWRKDRSPDDQPFKFFMKNFAVEVPNEKNKIVPSQWEKFKSNIIINPSKNYINSSPFYMYDDHMMIGGFAKKSFHYKNLLRLAGYDIKTEEKKIQTSYDQYNKFDTIHLLDNIAKYDRNLYDDFLDGYSEKILDNNNNVIHNGIIDKTKHGVFENTETTNTDIGSVKVYKGVKPMWEQLGFENEFFDVPEQSQYWKNIIPKTYTVLDRNGVTTQQLEDPMDGSLTPRIPREEYVIDETSDQNWKDGYRWPQLPAVDKFSVLANDTGSNGHLVNEPTKIFFGSKSSWSGDDELAKVTMFNDSDPDLIFNLNFNDVSNEEIEDTTNNYKVEHRTDFSVVLSPSERITKGSIYPYDDIDGDLEKQAF